MPRPPRPLDFDKEVPRIVRVNGAPGGQEQLSLDEQLPRREHGWLQIQPTDYGYIPRCRCGIPLREMPTKKEAQRELRRHIARTPQGRALVNTLRRVGRGSNNA